jgi:hypothetical protein
VDPSTLAYTREQASVGSVTSNRIERAAQALTATTGAFAAAPPPWSTSNSCPQAKGSGVRPAESPVQECPGSIEAARVGEDPLIRFRLMWPLLMAPPKSV